MRPKISLASVAALAVYITVATPNYAQPAAQRADQPPAIAGTAIPSRAKTAALPPKVLIRDARLSDLIVLEAYPERIEKSRQRFDTDLKSSAVEAARTSNVPQYIIVEASRRWSVDRVITVAFSGGTTAVLEQISGAAQDWIRLSGAAIRFQFKDRQGQFLRWAPTDTVHSSDIRIAFKTGREDGGYWSMVGRESVNRSLVGGKPGDASMNLAGFDVKLPADWQSVVRHEFGHALGFQHEHQSPAVGCDFRFENDPGYVDEKIDGQYVKNPNGKRPGLYTSLSGKPNEWKKPVVDFNLRQLPDTRAFSVGLFDRLSIMKYRFGEEMFIAGRNSPCYSELHENDSLSHDDIIGIRTAYPVDEAEVASLNMSRTASAKALKSLPNPPDSVRNATNIQLKALGISSPP